MPRKLEKTIKQFPRVAEILPERDTFYEQKGPIVWICKRHLQKIEARLESFEDFKKNINTIKESQKRLEKLKQKIIETVNQF